MKPNLTFRKVSPKDFMFINELLKSRGMLLGYPNCESMDEIIKELKVFENTIENCLNLIVHEEEIIGIGGLFYTEGDSEAMLFGPILAPVYHQKKYMKNVVEKLETCCVRGVNKIEAVISSENTLLRECLEEIQWCKKESQLQMERIVLDVENGPSNFDIHPIIEISEIVSMFHLLDEAFYWDGHTERMEELLEQGFEMVCAKDSQGHVLGVMSWSLINNEKVDLEYIVVNPKVRRQGVATSLLYYLFNWCHEHHAHEITLLTGLDNPAIQLYKSLGFLEVMMSTIYEKYCFND